MATEHILILLIQERDKLDRAIEALQGATKRRGRPPKDAIAVMGNEAGHGAPKKRKPLSAAVRKRMAAAQKKRWAEKKAEK
jgi:hypothetical protein